MITQQTGGHAPLRQWAMWASRRSREPSGDAAASANRRAICGGWGGERMYLKEIEWETIVMVSGT